MSILWRGIKNLLILFGTAALVIVVGWLLVLLVLFILSF